MESLLRSELFEGYEQDYATITDSISTKINTQVVNQRGEERKATVRAVERELDEAEEIVTQMDLELLNLPQSRVKLGPKLRQYRGDLEKLKRDLKRVVTYGTPGNERSELLSGPDARADLNVSSMDQRGRLLAGTERLNAASRRLEDSHRLALETEEVGQNILTDLRTQGEQLHHVRDTLHEADSYIDKASRTLKGMARRMATNKMITAAIIVVLVALILLVLYLKLS